MSTSTEQTLAVSAGADRQSAFDDLRRYLAAPEAAAEVGIHSSVTSGPIVPLPGARTAEEHAFARIVIQMELLGIDSAEFGGLNTNLSAAVARTQRPRSTRNCPGSSRPPTRPTWTGCWWRYGRFRW